MSSRTPFHLRRATVRALLCLAVGGPIAGAVHAADADGWPVIGRQGIVSLVLVPEAQATELAAYRQQIDRLCQPDQTCFLNFYTNSKGVPVVVPLPDEISSEATATFRRSTKIGAEAFMWSCRLKASNQECF
jgi:hypothetical protein